MISDNGPQFVSENFKQFATMFDFDHRTSSPYNSKSNGKAESAVKTAKSLLRKNKEGDQFLALLNYRNTPSQSTGTSPAQRFFNRRTRTLLPTCRALLKPKINVQADLQKLQANQDIQKKNFNRRSKDLPPLVEGDAVGMKPFSLGKKTWARATVISNRGRSYNVEAEDGTIYRRNRMHLKKIADKAPSLQPGTSPPTIEAQPSLHPAGKQPHRTLVPAATMPAAQQPGPAPSEASTTPPSLKTPARPRSTSATPSSPPKMSRMQTMTPPSQSRMQTMTTPSQQTPSPSRIPIHTRSGREVRQKRMKDFSY